MPWPQSAAPDLNLERARDCVGSSRPAWCTDNWRGECPVQGWWWRGSQKSKKPLKYTKMAKNGRFAHILAYKSPKMPFFAQKYLTRYTHETFFKEYMNFETHYLSHYRVIPLQSFGSHKLPQPHGLGLICIKHYKNPMQNLMLCVVHIVKYICYVQVKNKSRDGGNGT